MSLADCLRNLEVSLDERLLDQDYYMEFLNDVKAGDTASENARYIEAARVQLRKLTQEENEVYNLLAAQKPGAKGEQIKAKNIRLSDNQAINMWALANESEAVEDYARIEKNLGIKGVTPERAQEILSKVIDENDTGGDLTGNEADAYKSIMKFYQKQMKKGRVKERAKVREYPVELLDKTGKPLKGTGARNAKIELIGGTSVEVAGQIAKNIDSEQQYDELMEFVRDAIENVGAETDLGNYLFDVMELPADDVAMVTNAIVTGRAYLATAADAKAASAREVVIADTSKETGYAADVLETLIDSAVEADQASIDDTLSAVRKALIAEGASAQNANGVVQLINNLRNDNVEAAPTLFDQQKDFSNAKKDRKETLGTPISMYQKVHERLSAYGFNVPDPDRNSDVIDARVEAGRLLAQMVNKLHAAKAQVPSSLVLQLISARISSQDPLKQVYRRISQLKYDDVPLQAMTRKDDLSHAGVFMSAFRDNNTLRRAIKLSNSYAKDALGFEANSRAAAAFGVHTLAHEAVHMATLTSINFDPNVAKRVRELYNETIDVYKAEGLDIRNVHALLNVDEFIAEAFTNAKFQRSLNAIKSKSSGKTLWQKFLDLIGNLIGIDIQKNSVLHEVVALSDDLFQTKAESDATVAANQEQVKAYYETGLLPELDDLKQPGFKPADFKLKRELYHKLDPYTAGAAGVVVDMLENQGVNSYNGIIDKFKDGAKTSRAYALGMMMLDQLETTYGKLFDKLAANGNDNPLTTVARLWQKRQADAKAFEVKHNHLITEGNRLHEKHPKAMRDMYRLAHDATMFQVQINKPWAVSAPGFTTTRTNKKTGKTFPVSKRGAGAAQKAHAKAHAEFKKLPKAVQDMYGKMETFYKSVQEQVRGKVIENLSRRYSVTDLDAITFNKSLYDATTDVDVDAIARPQVTKKDGTTEDMSDEVFAVISKAVKNLNQSTMSGPYFPLDRFGDYAFNASFETNHTANSRDAAMELKQELEAEVPGSKTGAIQQTGSTYTFRHYGSAFIKRENKAELRKVQREYEDAGYAVESLGVLSDMPRGADNFASQIAAIAEKQLQRKGQGDKAYESARIALHEAMITLLPDTSIQRHMLKRKGTIGADMDMGRSLARYMKSAGWALSNLDHISNINDSMHDLNNASQTARKSGKFTNDQTETISQVANEMAKRNISTIRRPSAVVEWAAKFGFFNYLFSISYSVVNATQPALVALPWLTGSHGAKAATAALSRAYKLVGGQVASAAMHNKFGVSAFTKDGVDIDGVVKQLREHVRGDKKMGLELDDMLAKLQEEDIIGSTLTLEIAEEARGRGRRNRLSSLFHKTMEMGRTMPHLVEVLNRSTTAIAAYELGRGKGMSKEQATQYARKAVVKTQFDYSELNRPRYFTKNELLRVMTMFKIHPLGLYGFMIGNINGISDPETRKQSIRALSMLLATHAAFAGAAGGLLVEPLKVAMGMMAAVFGDEDDEWADWMRDPEINMRRLMYEATGSPALSEAFVYGLPRLAGVDMHSRLGLQNMMLMHSRGDTAFETSMNTITDSLLGPVLGASRGYSTMAAALANGQGLAKASEYAVPKGLRDVLRAARYLDEGMTDFNGNTILGADKLSAKDLAVRVIGFSPSVESEVREVRSGKTRHVSRLRRKIKKLVNRWKNAEPAERMKIWRGDISDYNSSLTREERRAFRITMAMLRRSLTARKRRERETEAGAHFARKERGLKKDYKFANIP